MLITWYRTVRLHDRVPQTPNKKIDRKALPAPDPDVAESENDFEPPVTAVEQTLAGLWSTLLCVKRVGRRDNFFESGGNSLLAMQLVGQIRDGLAWACRCGTLFESPTVAGLAETIEALSWSATSRVPAPAAGERGGGGV